MANDLTSNPIYMDTFSADVDVSTQRMAIKAIYFETNTNNDVLHFDDYTGKPVFRLPVSADTVDNGTTYNQPTGKWVVFGDTPLRTQGLVLDITDGNYDGTCYALIYV